MDHPVFHLDLVTPTHVLFAGTVSSVSAPGAMGGFQVLYNHAPLLALMTIGEIKINGASGSEERFATTGGVVDVRENRVVILAEAAERADAIDTDRARSSRDRARSRLEKKPAGVDVDRARRSLQRALNRLKVAGHPEGS